MTRARKSRCRQAQLSLYLIDPSFCLYIVCHVRDSRITLGGCLEERGKTELIADFENLVEELLKTAPNENQVKELMEKLNLDYHQDPVHRIGMVLEKMDKMVFESKKKKVEYDL